MSEYLKDLRAHLEKAGGRYVPPFLLWLDSGEVMLGHVVRGRVASAGAADPDRARELAAALLTYADYADMAALAGKPDDTEDLTELVMGALPAVADRGGAAAAIADAILADGRFGRLEAAGA